ncbi:MAG TPA: hypothetical protein VGD07_05750 [Methylomirabilota bacterium]
MTVQTHVSPTLDASRLYREGMIAGVLGAAAVAAWFLLLDALAGRPLWTPTVLGTALFRRGAGLDAAATLPVSPEMVWMFTWVHGLVFAALGGIAARLLGYVERHPGAGFGVLLLFVVFQFAFIAAATVFAAPVLRVLSAWSILVANLVAAAAMTAYLRRRHPDLRISP